MNAARSAVARAAFAAVAAVAASLSIGCATTPRHSGALTADESAALAAVQSLFDAIETKDSAAIAALVEDAATVTALRDTPAGWTRTTSTREQFAAGITRSRSALRETMTSPRVFVDGPLAVVWTPYDFFIDGAASHSGIDAIILIRDDAGAWRLHSIAYTSKPATPG